MIAIKKILPVGLTAVWVIMETTSVFAESFHLENTGVSLWTIILARAAIVVMQLVPASMLLFSLLAASSLIIFRREKIKKGMASEREKILLPGYEPTVIRERRRIGER